MVAARCCSMHLVRQQLSIFYDNGDEIINS
jgi:hypothetical protein